MDNLFADGDPRLRPWFSVGRIISRLPLLGALPTADRKGPGARRETIDRDLDAAQHLTRYSADVVNPSRR